ncbi:MAG: SAM-dependent methyltransferase [Verrucomicrobiota bacterium]
MSKCELRNLAPALALVCGVGIAYELVLMRVFAIAQWHHFAYMMISLAMLGFGAAGTLLSLLGERARRGAPQLFVWGAALLSLAIPLSHVLSRQIPFETFRLVSEPVQWSYLFLLYLLLAVPFFLISSCITAAFLMRPGHVGVVYFLNMASSGLGALAVTAAMYLAAPQHLVALLGLLALVAVLLVALPERRFPKTAMLSAVGAVGLAVWSAQTPPSISEYKELSYALDLPDAQIAARAHSPISELYAVRSEHLRETPGQISNYPMSELGPLPEQIGLYFDAGGASMINRFDGNFESVAYLDYVTAALPYRMLESPRVFVVGAGGGTGVLTALRNDSPEVIACEIDPNIFELVEERFGDFSGHLYSRNDVRPVIADGRGWLEGRPRERMDLIQIALLNSFSSSSAGVHALSESYLYTVEAVQTYLGHLTDDGMLAVTRWLKTPPRDAVKMFATLVEGAEKAGIENPADHLLWIRSWNTATLVLSRKPLNKKQVNAAVSFCEDRDFDLCHAPGIAREQVNKYTRLDEPVYFSAAQAILAKQQREQFYDDFLYHVRPPTDDSPYFFRFFKWKSLPKLVRGMGRQWVPFVEWGYLALLATVAQSVVAGMVLILLPMVVFSGRSGSTVRGYRLPVIFYFGLLGLGFMLLEIAFIQSLMRFLHYPVYAVAVVLTSFLFFSGLGSLAADHWHRFARRAHPIGIGALLLTAALMVAGTPFVFNSFMSWPDGGRIALGLAMLGPLAFLMGIPFPLGLQQVSDRVPRLIPWAWAINGCLSVFGATLATLLAIHIGFRMLVALAAICYLATIPCFRRLSRESAPATTEVNPSSAPDAS